MSDQKRITHQFMQAVRQNPLERVVVLALLMVGVLYAGLQVLGGDWLEAALAGLGIALLVGAAAVQPIQRRLLGGTFTGRHALYIALTWIAGVVTLAFVRSLMRMPFTGKSSEATYFMLILIVAFAWMLVRSLITLTPPFFRRFSTAIPVWEQVMLAINEAISAGLLALFGARLLVRLFQPDVFTLRLDLPYTLGIGAVVIAYYAGIQLMWVQRWNDRLSQNHVWVNLARVFAPLALIVTTMLIARRLIERADLRTADLLGQASLDLAVLALAPVIWLVILVVLWLVYTSGRGLRQRFLPDVLLDRLSPRVARALRSISDMDMLLILAVLATVIPAYLFLLGDRGGIIGILSGQIQQRGGALIETSEQALASLFTIPFYLLFIALLALYASALVRRDLRAEDRDELVSALPIGFLIVLIITLYLFAIPVTQVLIEGRLPRLPQDLGRILLFNVVIPLILLYAHYFLLVRLPYGRGQNRWRQRQSSELARSLSIIEGHIGELNGQIARLDQAWADDQRMETLYRYVQLNSRRDDLNMQRLQVVAERQALAELSEAPVALAVARLPVRVVSIGVPLLLIIQIYQWAILNNGLQEILNNPNITVLEFFRALLQQAQF
jgi:hypothetical protein